MAQDAATRPSDLKAALHAEPDLNAYAVVDGARRDDLRQVLFDTDAENACLFIGALEPEVASVAPYLVALPEGHPVVDRLAEGWGRSEAIYALSPLDLGAMRKHFRTLTLARIPDGRTVFFRFYDPRVLRSVAPILEPAQRTRFYGKAVARYLCENEDGGLLRFDAQG